ncbi:response regulator [Lewinella sp. W8]|uniref:response regulator n=1 Tax=Lewinella sp. W8 TaxID=2528208 RepID=UPI0010678CE6|nr:response regulator [Lewinella sp. W8]MTB49731.1 response regulator [Lewinella sp. W8]
MKRGKILLVDDEPAIRTALDFLVSKAGYETAVASDGKEAIAVATTFQPQVAVLDVMMPEMDGFTVAERLREIPGLSDVRIVFLTARSRPEDRYAGYQHGGEVYLTKPFDNQDLLDVLGDLFIYG